jgi:hypothetical protein
LNHERDISRIKCLIKFYTKVRLKHVSVRIIFLHEDDWPASHTHPETHAHTCAVLEGMPKRLHRVEFFWRS